MSGRGEAGGSRFLYAPFDAANARIEANERVAEERWQALEYRLNAIETALERVERRLWLAVFGVVSVVLAQAINEIIQMSSGG
ncbi:GTA head formation protein, RCAP_rcc01685 family [Nioella sp.]|uniref:GTA head formation protein, RCAP_rcc01685 family n=1 Tax=Nioella sp. TaxID=1912091 RepID=UPI003B51722B